MSLFLVPPPVQTMNMKIDKPPLLNVDYPSVYGIKNNIIQHRINTTIYSLLLKLVQSLQYPQITTYVSTAYEIKNNQKDILSLILDGLGDFHGAHPVNSRKSLTFDCLTGKNYELSELFKPGSEYIEKLSIIIKKQIKERNITLTEDFKLILPNQDYYVADLCIVIYFQQYEIAPRPEGFPSFPIPIYSIQDLIIDGGILFSLL